MGQQITLKRIALFLLCLLMVLVPVYGFWSLVGGGWLQGIVMTIGFLMLPQVAIGVLALAATIHYFIFYRRRQGIS